MWQQGLLTDMPNYRGQFQYVSQNRSVAQQGGCEIQFDAEKFTLTPDSGEPLVFDLGDVDAVVAADYELRLPLYTGDAVRLQQFGKAYQDLSRELLDSHRQRALECLLLEDMTEVDRFTGAFILESPHAPSLSGPAEFRLFKSNLAVLPSATQGFQWRLADISAIHLDAQNYEVTLERSGERLRISRLAKRTELFHTTLRDAIATLKAESAQALHAILPFLNPSQLQAAAGILREGHSTLTGKLAAIHPRIPEVLAANAVDKGLKPYYEDLLGRIAKNLLFAGFKLIRPEDRDLLATDAEQETAAGDATSDDSGGSIPDADEAAPDALYWFFFPLATQPGSPEPGKVVAWEASSRSGRATYFFRLPDAARSTDAVELAVQRINRVLGMLNFRRRPIYLSDDELTGNPVFLRYAIAARRIPELREVRARFLGRAAHTSLEVWQAQVKNILAKADGMVSS